MSISLLGERGADKRGDPVIIEVAINGMTTPARNPQVPQGPEEIAACARRCLDAGASVIHTHNSSIERVGDPHPQLVDRAAPSRGG